MLMYKVQLSQMRNLSFWKLGSWYSSLVKLSPPHPPYRHVVQIGDPVLRTLSEPVSMKLIKTIEIQLLVKQLKEVLKRYDCVGISAPQLGVPLRIFVIEFNTRHAKDYRNEEFNNREMNILPQKVIINPEMKITDFSKIVHPEKCGSITGFEADVPRYRGVEVRGFNEKGEHIKIGALGWNARIIQHEMDHLNGRFYTDIMDRKTLNCTCWQTVNERRGKVVLPFTPD